MEKLDVCEELRSQINNENKKTESEFEDTDQEGDDNLKEKESIEKVRG